MVSAIILSLGVLMAALVAGVFIVALIELHEIDTFSECAGNETAAPPAP